MKIAIIGSRGLPASYGGFETFAEQLSCRIAESGIHITVQCDKKNDDSEMNEKVKLYYSSVTKSAHPLWYYYEGIKWGLKNYDIVLITGTGGSIFYFLNFFYRKTIITNIDGIESARSKWSLIKKFYITLSERLAVWFSDLLIADSAAIEKYLLTKYKHAAGKINLITYGAEINNDLDNKVLSKYQVAENNYFLIVSRIEPENNIRMILEGYLTAMTEIPLLVVGHTDRNSYAKRLKSEFDSNMIRFVGGIYDKHELNVLRYSCKAYFHGHSVGGTNPSLLEAMASGNLIICHDNIFNREVTNDSQIYFSTAGDVTKAVNFTETISQETRVNMRRECLERIKNIYNWEIIASEYLEMFENSLNR